MSRRRNWKASAVKSLVRVHFTKRNTGMGVVVEDSSGVRSIITAAHCVRHRSYPHAMGAGNTDLLVGVSAFGSPAAPLLMSCVMSWEPCADIAVLGLETLSGTISPNYKALDKFLTDCIPAPLCLDVASHGKKFRVHICQHTGKWISGVVAIYDTDNRVPALLWSDFPKTQHILGGTSGSPAFDDAGRVVAVVSATIGPRSVPHKIGMLTCLAGALPGWMLDSLSRRGA